MIAYVEFVGAPGAGKSTIARSLARNGRSARTWTPLRTALRPELREVRSPGGLARWALFRAAARPDGRALDRAAESVLRTVPELSELLLHNLGARYGGDRAGLRVHRVHTWRNHIAAIERLRTLPSSGTVLLDEGLLHPDFQRPEASEDDVRRYLDLVPYGPSGLIVLRVDPDVALRRQAERGASTVTFMDLSDAESLEQLADLDRIAGRVGEVAGERAVPVLEVDAHDTVERSVARIDTFLAGLRTGP